MPAPATLIDGVQKLEPGCWLCVEANGTIEQQRYWELQFGAQPGDEMFSANEWRDQLLQHLLAAVRRRNVAAVDVGVLLSGGVDSSLLVGLLAEISPNGFQTFSIGFDSVGEEKGDEFQYSDLIARKYETTHHRMHIPESRMLEALPSAIAAMNEPMVSHDCVAFYLLSQEVSRHCRVVQSGQGADEVFAGYHWYPPLVGSKDPVKSYRDAFFRHIFLL